MGLEGTQPLLSATEKSFRIGRAGRVLEEDRKNKVSWKTLLFAHWGAS